MGKILFKFPTIELVVSIISFVSFSMLHFGTAVWVFCTFVPAMFYHFLLALLGVRKIVLCLIVPTIVTAIGIYDWVVGPFGILDGLTLPAGIGLFIGCGFHYVWLRFGVSQQHEGYKNDMST